MLIQSILKRITEMDNLFIQMIFKAWYLTILPCFLLIIYGIYEYKIERK